MPDRIIDLRNIERPYKAEGGPFELGARTKYIVTSDNIYGLHAELGPVNNLVIVARRVVPIFLEKTLIRGDEEEIKKILDNSDIDSSLIGISTWGVSDRAFNGRKRIYVGSDVISVAHSDQYGLGVNIRAVERIDVESVEMGENLPDLVRRRLGIVRS